MNGHTDGGIKDIPISEVARVVTISKGLRVTLRIVDSLVEVVDGVDWRLLTRDPNSATTFYQAFLRPSICLLTQEGDLHLNLTLKAELCTNRGLVIVRVIVDVDDLGSVVEQSEWITASSVGASTDIGAS